MADRSHEVGDDPMGRLRLRAHEPRESAGRSLRAAARRHPGRAATAPVPGSHARFLPSAWLFQDAANS